MYSQFFFPRDTATLTRNLPFRGLSLLGRLQTPASISEHAACLFSGFLKRLHPHWPILWVYSNWFCTVVPPTHAPWCAVSRPAQSKFKKETQTKPKNTTQYPYEELLSSCCVVLAQGLWCILVMQGVNSENWFTVKFIFVNVSKLLYLSLTISFGYYFLSEILARLSLCHHKS